MLQQKLRILTFSDESDKYNDWFGASLAQMENLVTILKCIFFSSANVSNIVSSTFSNFPLRKLGNFAPFKLPAFLWGTYLLKLKVIYSKLL